MMAVVCLCYQKKYEFYLSQAAKDNDIKSLKCSLTKKENKMNELGSKLLAMETKLKQEIECKNSQISTLHKKFDDVKDLIASESSIYSSRIANIISGAEPSDQESGSVTAGNLVAMT